MSYGDRSLTISNYQKEGILLLSAYPKAMLDMYEATQRKLNAKNGISFNSSSEQDHANQKARMYSTQDNKYGLWRERDRKQPTQ